MRGGNLVVCEEQFGHVAGLVGYDLCMDGKIANLEIRGRGRTHINHRSRKEGHILLELELLT